MLVQLLLLVLCMFRLSTSPTSSDEAGETIFVTDKTPSQLIIFAPTPQSDTTISQGNVKKEVGIVVITQASETSLYVYCDLL